MHESIHLGRIGGIRVGVHWSMPVVFWLIAWSLAGGALPHAAPGYSGAAYVITAVAITAVFYGGLLAHELAHALVARRRGIEVDGIVLWLLGGVSKLEGEAADPDGELRIAAAGPAMSFALAAGFLALSRLSAAIHPGGLVAGALGWLGWINGMLALFNLLPAFPLDGGRVLRSLLWRWRGDKPRATAAAARAGQGFGYGFVGLGLFGLVAGRAGFSGLWLAAIGWFLISASGAEARASAQASELAGWRAADAMAPDPLTVPYWVTLDRLVDEGVHRRRLSSFPVVDLDAAFAGLVTLARIQAVPADQWPHTVTAAVAGPPAGCVTCDPGEDLATVVRRMARATDPVAVVLDHGRVVGMITPADIERLVAAPVG